MEEHLSGRVRCRRELDSWRHLESALLTFPVIPEPPDLKSSVMARIRRGPALRPRFGYGWTDLALGIGVCLVAVGVIALVAPIGAALNDPAASVWERQVPAFAQAYLLHADPKLLAAGWLLIGAMAVAVLGVASSGPRRRRA